MHSTAQESNGEASEVYLTFQYQGVVGVYLTSYYQDDQFYLPVSELFNVLEIQNEVSPGELSISGNYLGNSLYKFDFQTGNPSISVGGEQIELSADDYLIKEVDYFVQSYLLEELFGLTFSVDYSSLTLKMETPYKMPVVARYEREQKRQRLDRTNAFFEKNYFPLQYKRQYGILDGGFLDYNISAIYSGGTQLLTSSNTIGMEFLGGDVQGNLFAAVSDEQQSFRTNNLRWRHVRRDNPIFSTIIAGQTVSEGIASRSITGIKINNKPVEPRRLFDRYVINGQTTPESEVELYLNNQLIDYQTADGSGNYRFVVPLTYGNTNYSVRIFTPSGRAIERNSRIQIPFEYLPPGEVDFSASFGRLDENILGSELKGYQAAGSVTTGLTPWLTARFSSEYLSEFHNGVPSFTGTLNGRLFSRYLFSFNANSENFYRIMGSVVYSDGTSWSANYDYNPGNSQLYNIGGNDHQAGLNIFKPFTIGTTPLNLRLSSNFLKNGSAELLRYRADVSTRLQRLNIRLGYQDQQITPLVAEPTSTARLSNSYTYSVSRSNNLPQFFESMFLRSRLTYLPGIKKFEELEFQVSKDIWETSRIRFSYEYNFRASVSSYGLNFTLDFNKIRSNSSLMMTQSEFTANQSFRGSVGYDSYANQLILNNRQQAGQSGAAVRLYIDNNNDGVYQESIDDPINDPAVRVGRAGGRTRVKNGVNYIDQLLPYYRYNIEINRSALSNPLLVPSVENFSIVTDPNQYKKIEIPFYLSGVIDGRVQRLQTDSTKTGVAGLKLYLKQKNGDYIQEIRTFSDGSFYAYEIPPGEYTLSADSTQLEILGTVTSDGNKDFTVNALAQGDFITGLNFELVPKSQESEQLATEGKTPETSNTLLDLLENENSTFEIQLASYDDEESARKAARQAQLLFKKFHRIIFNDQNNKYLLRTYPVKDRSQAINLLRAASNSPFTNPALVVKGDSKITEPPQQFKTETTYRIQLGAFSTMKNAINFANDVKEVLKQQIEVTYDEEMALYKVTTYSFYDSIETPEILRTLRRNTPYVDSFITKVSEPIYQEIEQGEINSSYNYSILIEGVTPQAQQAYLSAVTGDSDVDINQPPQKDLLIFEELSSFSEAIELREKLSQISTIGRPIIVLIEDK